MAKRVPALVEGAILKWARESGGYSIEDIAARFGKDAETIRAWEEDEKSHPYMGQLRNLATLQKHPDYRLHPTKLSVRSYQYSRAGDHLPYIMPATPILQPCAPPEPALPETSLHRPR